MKTVDINFIVIGASWLLVGMLLGIGMGAAHNFALAPLHAHINLIGFVCHSVFGMAYRHWPALKDSPLAPYQFWIFVIASADHADRPLLHSDERAGTADDHRVDRRPDRRGAVRRDDLDPTPARVTGAAARAGQSVLISMPEKARAACDS